MSRTILGLALALALATAAVAHKWQGGSHASVPGSDRFHAGR